MQWSKKCVFKEFRNFLVIIYKELNDKKKVPKNRAKIPL